MNHRTLAISLLIMCAASAGSAADLPDWFEANRVQAHCELYRLQDNSAGAAYHALIRDTGARAVTLIVDNLDEGAWWASSVGETHEMAQSRDMARAIVESAHGAGLKVIAYYRSMSDGWAQREHPGWQCRDAKGELVREPRGKNAKRQISVMCLNSPYRDFIQTRLCELTERGVDVIYFDSWHMPEVCCCAFCQKKFESVTGEKFPLATPAPAANAGQTGAEKAGDPRVVEDADGRISLMQTYSADYLRVSRFVSDSLIETFTQWRAAVQKINPEVRLAIGSSLYPMFLGQPQLSGDFIAIADTSKTEFKKEFGGNAGMLKRLKAPDVTAPAADIQMALGWSLVRDACDGRPPLMWIPHVTSEADALRSSAAAYSHGCVASLAFMANSDSKGMYQSSFANGARVSGALAGARPYGWLAIHISESARNRRLASLPTAWKEVIAPALGAFETAIRAHWPVVTINDYQLARGVPAETRALALASPDELTPEQKTAVAAWEAQGGKVIRLPAGEDWHTTEGRKTQSRALIQQVASAGAPPVRVTGPATMHAVCFRPADGSRLVVALVNQWDDYEATARTPLAPPCAGVSIQIDPAFFPAATATELLTGTKLDLGASGAPRVEVPEFEINRCVVFER